MRLFFLYSRIVSYVEGMFTELSRHDDVEQLHVMHWDANLKLPHRVNCDHTFQIYKRSQHNKTSILRLLQAVKPNIVYVSGWMDQSYIHAAREYKKREKNVLVVGGIDDQWFGTPRQLVGRVYFRCFYKTLFDYLWVTGCPQYHYARMLGYDDRSIIHFLYSANSDFAGSTVAPCRRILYLGRFAPEKNVLYLIREFNRFSEANPNSWTLTLIGHGPLEDAYRLELNERSEILPFSQGELLRRELAKGGVFCLPSLREPWGVVVHEMASMGYPLLLANNSGSSSQFLIHGYNGYRFDSLKPNELTNILSRISKLEDGDLSIMGRRSAEMAKSISTEKTVNSLLSIVK